MADVIFCLHNDFFITFRLMPVLNLCILLCDNLKLDYTNHRKENNFNLIYSVSILCEILKQMIL